MDIIARNRDIQKHIKNKALSVSEYCYLINDFKQDQKLNTVLVAACRIKNIWGSRKINNKWWVFRINGINPQETLSIKEVSELEKITINSIYQRIQKGKMKPHGKCGSYYFFKSELKEGLKNKTKVGRPRKIKETV